MASNAMNPVEELLQQMSFANGEHYEASLVALYGVEAENFFHSPSGRLMIAAARRDMDAFLDWCFKPEADAADFHKMRARAMAARMNLRWLAETITNGQMAERTAAAIEATHNE